LVAEKEYVLYGRMVSSGLPMLLIRMSGIEPHGWVVFVATRLHVCFLSLLVDMVVYRLYGQSALYALRGSWISIVFFSRPFSNTIETICLALVLYAAHESRAFWFGVVSAFGCFARITFPAFGIPVGFYALFRKYDFVMQAQSKGKKIGLIYEMAKYLTSICGGLGLGLIIHLGIDSAFVASVSGVCHNFTFTLAGYKFVLAPLNNLIYNMNPVNLAQHGLHPRYIHVLVNMQLLFSPIWVMSLFRWKQLQVLTGVVLLGLIVLSVAPHQEPRFLLPLVVPVSVSMGTLVYTNKRVRLVWVLFNLALALFYGVVHQAGVVPSLLSIQSRECIATYETYSGPRFLLGGNLHTLRDFGGSDPHDVRSIMSKAVECQRWLVVLPGSVLSDLNLNGTKALYTFCPHFSGERPPRSLNELCAQVHEYTL